MPTRSFVVAEKKHRFLTEPGPSRRLRPEMFHWYHSRNQPMHNNSGGDCQGSQQSLQRGEDLSVVAWVFAVTFFQSYQYQRTGAQECCHGVDVPCLQER